MSWLHALYETYDRCAAARAFDEASGAGGAGSTGLGPVSHISQQAHICVSIDTSGGFIRADLLEKTQILIPATEDSAVRTSGVAPHPLCDNLSYCAHDYGARATLADTGTGALAFAGGKRKKGAFTARHSAYIALLGGWCASAHSHPKARAVLAYLKQRRLIPDLVAAGIVWVDAQGMLCTTPPKDCDAPLFALLQADGKTRLKDQGKALVCWRVVGPGPGETRVWKDASLHAAWVAYDASCRSRSGACLVCGKVVPVAEKHPRNIRRPGDGAKLISSNDAAGFTYRGRFFEAEEACTIGYEVSQKAHSVLRWLIARQGYRNGEQTVIAWTPAGQDLPQPCNGKWLESWPNQPAPVADPVAVLALESATPGRLAVTFYRELFSAEYLERLHVWRRDLHWVLPRVVSTTEGARKKIRTEWRACAPSPREVALAAYGERIDDKLLKSTIERLLTCIVDAAPLPRDVVEHCVRRAISRTSREKYEWNRTLAVACAVYKGYYARHVKPSERRMHSMVLDTEKNTRDYLYGRLLAVAEYVERSALDMAGENRPTNAERLMQRFADHPCSTWRQLELQIKPSMQRLRHGKHSGLHTAATQMLREICDKFCDDDFTAARKLSGEFLLGYHCQMSDLSKQLEQVSLARQEVREGVRL